VSQFAEAKGRFFGRFFRTRRKTSTSALVSKIPVGSRPNLPALWEMRPAPLGVSGASAEHLGKDGEEPGACPGVG